MDSKHIFWTGQSFVAGGSLRGSSLYVQRRQVQKYRDTGTNAGINRKRYTIRNNHRKYREQPLKMWGPATEGTWTEPATGNKTSCHRKYRAQPQKVQVPTTEEI
jgi:hypothetical protein